MTNTALKVLCLSGSIIFSQQTFTAPQTPSTEGDLDLSAVERDAKAFFHRKRLDAYRASKKLLTIDANLAASLYKYASVKTAPANPNDNNPTPVLPWFNFCWGVYSKEIATELLHQRSEMTARSN